MKFEVGKKYTVERILSMYEPWPNYLVCTVAHSNFASGLRNRFCTEYGSDFGWFTDEGECPISAGVAAKITGEYMS